MTTPNPTPTTLREILERLNAEIAIQICGNFALKKELGELSPAILDQATQSIQQQLKALLPKKKRDTSAEDLRAGTFTRGQDLEVYGFNQAIDQIEKAIDDFCSGKGKE